MRGLGVLIGVIAMVAAVVGCASYRLEGIVVDGPIPSMSIVDKIDPLRDQIPISEAAVSITIDPRSLGAKQLPMVFTDAKGHFSVPVDEVGAGAFAEYEFEIVVRAPGYGAFADRRMLPFGSKKLIVVMRPGRDRGTTGTSDILQDTLEWKKQMEN